MKGGSKGQLYDIYVIKTAGSATGIESIPAAEAAKDVKVMKFSKNGRLVIQKGNTIYNVAGLKLN